MIMEQVMKNSLAILFLMTIYMFSKTHIMNNLIIVELMVVSILTTMFFAINMMNMENYTILYFIIVVICESMVGLSLMIAMIRTHSNDYLKSLSTMKF